MFFQETEQVSPNIGNPCMRAKELWVTGGFIVSGAVGHNKGLGGAPVLPVRHERTSFLLEPVHRNPARQTGRCRARKFASPRPAHRARTVGCHILLILGLDDPLAQNICGRCFASIACNLARFSSFHFREMGRHAGKSSHGCLRGVDCI